MSNRPHKLSTADIWNPCDLDVFDFDTTAALPPDVTIIGQERAVRAIDFGVSIASSGFNVYALGHAGTGRSTTIRALLEAVAADQPVPDDWIYVNDFLDPNRPRAISLPPGLAVQFHADMEELVTDLLREIPRAFESKDYEQQRELIVREMQDKRGAQFDQLEHKVNEQGFTLLKTAMGLGVAPVLNGQVLTPEAYQKLDPGTRKDIESRQRLLQTAMSEAMRGIHDLERHTKRRLEDFDREIADYAVTHFIEELKERYRDLDEVPEYLAQVHKDIVDSAVGFRQEEQPTEGLSAAMVANRREALLKRYRVNVIIDNSNQRGAPVVLEANPTHSNLVGRIEHRSEFGALVTDFTMIKAGSLHRANGGYLVVEMSGLLDYRPAWDALKRSLKNQQVRIEGIGAQMQLVSTVTLEPEPVPLNLKVLLIGDPWSFYMLHGHDEDFRELFKVQADFGSDIERTPESCQSYAHFVAARCHQEQLLPFDTAAVGRVVEFGSRLAEHQGKLATRFGDIADLVREASFWASRQGRSQTTAADVQTAIDEREHRANRSEHRVQDLIEEGVLRVDVTGTAVGQVNGLSVLSLGNYSFGKPSRITVRTYTGRSGVVSLDREAKLSGSIYDKGLLTLTGYLGGKYALTAPLSLSATISFEQLHEEIDGDSASSTELYALLSSLSGLPLVQGIAATGAVDQQGNVQPVGGVNEKIEGFFEACSRRGLTGEQGVILPAQNVSNLMLKAQVRQAVEDGSFHIYPVRSIDKGLEILTGVSAGDLREDGTYPPDSVHGRVVSRLLEIAENLKPKGADDDEADDDSQTGLGGELPAEQSTGDSQGDEPAGG
jgi:lon-related putative ATP-dependent protease